MTKLVTITTLVALTMGGIACSSHERVVKENTERSYSSTVPSPTRRHLRCRSAVRIVIGRKSGPSLLLIPLILRSKPRRAQE